MKSKTISIIGSGISGSSIARILSDDFRVQIFERSQSAGGIIKCERIGGVLFHKVGGHVFNSKNQLVLDWFWSIFDKSEEFIPAKRRAKILINEQLIGYPIENFIYQLPNTLSKKIFTELIEIASHNTRFSARDSKNFRDYLIQAFGLELFRLYFEPYNKKIWNVDLSEVPLEWLDGKLPMPDLYDVLLSNFLREEESSMVHANFYYPKINGSQFIIDRLLETIVVHLNHSVHSIQLQDNKSLIQFQTNNGEFESDILIYTGDVRRLADIVNTNDFELREALNNLKKLKSNGTTNILCETDKADISWLYLPENNVKAHRIIYTGNFSPTNNKENSRCSCVVEFSGRHDYESILSELKFLPGNLSPLASNYEECSYIIQDNDTRQNIEIAKAALSRHNIFLLGRFAEWEYFNMDKCIESAFAVAKQIRGI